MERFREAYPPLTKHWAALLVGDTWRVYSNPTIGDIRSLRQKGAIILHLIIERNGNQIDRTWVTDTGVAVVVRTDFLPRGKQ